MYLGTLIFIKSFGHSLTTGMSNNSKGEQEFHERYSPWNSYPSKWPDTDVIIIVLCDPWNVWLNSYILLNFERPSLWK